jgi:PKD repeat protein
MFGSRSPLPLFLLSLLASGPADAEPAAAGGTGACCFGGDDCEQLAAEDCAERGGTYHGDGTSCDPPLCAVALTPVIGVAPEALSFGQLCPGNCRDLALALRNAAPDPESQLIVSDLIVHSPFSLVNPPATPLTIPGDGSLVPLTIRYCATGSGPQIGSLTIVAPNGLNSPLMVPLDGVSDPAPLCDAGGPYFGVPNLAITFDARGSSDPGGTIATYSWDFGDGATATGPVVTHAYALGGNYTVELDLSDNCGGTSSCETTAIVGSNLPPICDAGGPYSGVVDVPIAMSGAGSHDPDGVIVFYRWNFGDGHTATGVAQNHIYSSPGSFTVSLMVTDNQSLTSTCTTTASVGVTNSPPLCDAGGPYSGAAGQPIEFDGSASSDPDGTIVAYAWQFGDCETGTGPTPTHTYPSPGSFVASLCVTDDAGGTSCCEAPVNVTAPGARPTPAVAAKTEPANAFGANPNIVFPLHAETGCYGCGPISADCLDRRPVVNVTANTQVTIYLTAFNYTAVAGVQTAFAWDSGWELLGALFDCLPGQLNAVTPAPPGGPTAGTVTSAFNCVTGPNLLVIGRLLMITGSSGCLGQVQSTYPYGIHAVDCELGLDLIPNFQQERLGRICVGSGGIDACAPKIPVEATTWGQVKATYR